MTLFLNVELRIFLIYETGQSRMKYCTISIPFLLQSLHDSLCFCLRNGKVDQFKQFTGIIPKVEGSVKKENEVKDTYELQHSV